MEIVLVILAVGAVAVVFRLAAGGMDHERVDEYVRSKGGTVIDKSWNPFGKGRFGEQNARIYEVTYQDGDGNVHRATCKTSVFSGVYFTEDVIVERGEMVEEASHAESLEEENRRLRDEIERLRTGDSEH